MPELRKHPPVLHAPGNPLTELSSFTAAMVSTRFDSVRHAKLAESAADLAIDLRYLVAMSDRIPRAGASAAENPIELQICATAVLIKVKA